MRCDDSCVTAITLVYVQEEVLMNCKHILSVTSVHCNGTVMAHFVSHGFIFKLAKSTLNIVFFKNKSHHDNPDRNNSMIQI